MHILVERDGWSRRHDLLGCCGSNDAQDQGAHGKKLLHDVLSCCLEDEDKQETIDVKREGCVFTP
jgi:hypothetical protein